MQTLSIPVMLKGGQPCTAGVIKFKADNGDTVTRIVAIVDDTTGESILDAFSDKEKFSILMDAMDAFNQIN